jgi:hypothetical protein
MDPVLKKMVYKGQSPVLLMHPPAEFGKVAASFSDKPHSTPKASYAFVLAFCKSMSEAETIAGKVAKSLEEKGVFWLAYPKGTSKKYKNMDINRDTGNAMMLKRGFEGVSMVSIDEDWSAMRFKRL